MILFPIWKSEELEDEPLELLFFSKEARSGLCWNAPDNPILSKLRSLSLTLAGGYGYPATLKCEPIWKFIEVPLSSVKSEFSLAYPPTPLTLDELFKWCIRIALACLNPFSITFLCLSSSVSTCTLVLSFGDLPSLLPLLDLWCFYLCFDSRSSKLWMMSFLICLLMALTSFSSRDGILDSDENDWMWLLPVNWIGAGW